MEKEIERLLEVEQQKNDEQATSSLFTWSEYYILQILVTLELKNWEHHNCTIIEKEYVENLKLIKLKLMNAHHKAFKKTFKNYEGDENDGQVIVFKNKEM